jgi:hypothetical protein
VFFGLLSLSSKTALADSIPFMAVYSSPEAPDTTQSNEITMNRLSSGIIFLFIVASSSPYPFKPKIFILRPKFKERIENNGTLSAS